VSTIDPAEKLAADYLLTLPKDERAAAAARINQLVKAQAPPSDSEPAQPPVRNLGEYVEDKIEVPPFLVSQGQLVAGEISVMIARAGKGKTTYGMNRLIRWGAGLPMFDDLEDSQAPLKPLKICLIENEGAAYFMQEKLDLLLKSGAGLDEQQQRLAKENVLIWGDGGYSGLKIDRPDDLELLRRAADTHEPDAFMIEPFRGIWRGEENDATAMEAVLDDMVQLCSDFGCAVMLAHHERKSGAGEDGEEMSRARGFGDLEGKVATMENWRSVKNDQFRELSWSKSRYAPKAPPIRMIFNHADWRYELVPEDEIGASILGLMSEDPTGWYTKKDIAEALEETERKLAKPLEGLQNEEKIVRKTAEKGTPGGGFRFRLVYDEDSSTGLGI
jgi:hypothetical protein